MEQPRYILAGWLIDGSGGPMRKRVLLTVAGGRFAAIDDFRKDNAPDPSRVTDLSQCTVLPPLVDCHVHLAMSPALGRHRRGAGFEELRQTISGHLHDHFSHGVLAVRDAGDRNGHAMRYLKECGLGAGEPVALKVTGRGWHQKGGYGEQIGRCPGRGETLATAFSKERAPVDQVKLVNSGPVSVHEFGAETPPQFEGDDLRQVVLLAAGQGTKVMVHANGSMAVRSALEAGCHSIEHGFFMGGKNLELMAARGAVWIPTAVIMKALLEDIKGANRVGDRGVVEKNLHHQLEQISLARQCGVTVALGTDAGSPGILHGESAVEELALLMQGGFTLPEAVRCATYNGASLLGIAEDTGLIGPGRPAHFIVAKGTPTQLPRKLSYLETIYLDGKPCNRNFFHQY